MYVMTVTYNNSSDYICRSYERLNDALEDLERKIKRELQWVEKDGGYTPTVKRHRDNDVTLIYAQDADEGQGFSETYYKVMLAE